MAYDIISKLSDPTIASKVELITYLIKRAEEQRSNEEFKGSISTYLSEREKFPYLGSYCLIGPKYALGCLVGHFLYHYVSEKDLRKQINVLVSLLNYVKGFQPSENPLLKKIAVIKLINILEQFGIPEYFLKTPNNRPLRIYHIPYQHADANAGYYPHLNSIVSYRPREADLDPEYIFLHEVGHLFTFALTGDPGGVPDSFIEFNTRFNPKWKGDLIEVFVDLFSMAVMMDTAYASKNPFIKTFPVGKQNIVRDYFIKLVKGLGL
ncbi:hypothetical protein GFS24_17610 [Chitinophaga sp. SYP-B3965]|uniref:hypothetical protein n=1 Tax=Chitinophaga sp. SYP-B3965 TaxID=2663120 RepID=UPI001299F887|nr:hypothetical protein [Chitinophaga sp. SYP-B3965]MRG46943.1 hypothetical protein [Chitinophaga sp. SYP-B3965]